MIINSNGVNISGDSAFNPSNYYIKTDVDELMNEKMNASTVLGKSLVTSNWSDNSYSFEKDYPTLEYDIEIEPDSSCTADQYAAWCDAKIVGSSTSNIVKAFGTVPTLDIPIIVKVVKK